MWPLYARWLAHSKHPILVGPFRGEVGFEAMYWEPWLAAFRHRYQIPDERIIPVTRGGAGAWYQVPRGLELYALRTPRDVRVENKRVQLETEMLKQMTVTNWDRAVIADAAESLNLPKYHVLHPSWMYHDLLPYMWGQRGVEWLAQRTRFQQPLPTPSVDLQLPTPYVAVSFYARYTFPMHEQTAMVARTTIEQLAQQTAVILLTTGTHFDDHQSFVPKKRPANVYCLHELAPAMTPEDNLLYQSAVIAHALGFVGSYGGMSQLALRFGKPSVSFYTEWGGTSFAHLALSEWLSLATGIPYVVQRVKDVPMLRGVLPPLVAQPAPAPTESGGHSTAAVVA